MSGKSSKPMAKQIVATRNFTMGSFILISILLFALNGFGDTNAESARDEFLSLSRDELKMRVDDDFQQLGRLRRQLDHLEAFMAENERLFQRRSSFRRLNMEERAEIRSCWKTLLDIYLATDSMRLYYADFLKLDNRASRHLVFQIYYAAFLMQYRHALAFLAYDLENPEFDTILNEPMPGLGLPEGSYTDFKFRFLNVAIAAEFAALHSLSIIFRGEGMLFRDQKVRNDEKFIWQMGKGRGELMTLINAGDFLRHAGTHAFFPVQAGISEWMGDTRVWREGKNLVSHEQIKELQGKILPGDILLARREWYLSNIGLPGYWPHAALYIGTPEERSKLFSDELTRNWIRSQGIISGDFEQLLQSRVQAQYVLSSGRYKMHKIRVIEARSEGVIFTSLEDAAACDSLAVLRPRVPNRVRAQAIMNAFQFHGLPYDFDFNFLTDHAMVCTELVSKAYEAKAGDFGIQFPFIEVLGRQVIPANEMARLYDEEFGRFERQLDFVYFLDANEKTGKAELGDVDEFRQSWKRPKWHIILPEKESVSSKLSQPEPAGSN